MPAWSASCTPHPGPGRWSGSLFTGWTARIRHQGRAIAACVVVWGGTIALFGVMPVLWVGLTLLAVAGAADIISAVFRQNVQQRAVPDHLQGRLSGTFFAVVAGGPRLGDLETGVAAAIGGPEFAVWSGGLACVVGVGVLLWRVPELWADDGGGRPLSAGGRAGGRGRGHHRARRGRAPLTNGRRWRPAGPDQPVDARATSSSLTDHSRAAAASSRALADGVFTLHLAKYLPVTPSTSGDEHR